MYQLWLQNNNNNNNNNNERSDKNNSQSNKKNGKNKKEDNASSSDGNHNSNNKSIKNNEGEDSQGVSVSSCITKIKETVLKRTQYNDTFLTLLSQLGLLMKSPEPCRTHASDLLEIMMLPAFLERDIVSLEKMFPIPETYPGYIAAFSIALGLLAESEHLVSPSLVNAHFEDTQFYHAISLNYYLKSSLLTSHFSGQSAITISALSTLSTKSITRGAGGATTPIDGDTTQNSIACMLLGSLYLRTNVTLEPPEKVKLANTNINADTLTVYIPKATSVNNNKKKKIKAINAADKTLPTEKNEQNNFDYQAAFDYYKLAAQAHNPIAQHKYVISLNF